MEATVAPRAHNPCPEGQVGSTPTPATKESSMPTYEYQCEGCKHAWEAEQSIRAEPQKECPKCHHETAKRLISSGGFILQGGGWYKDGYSKD